MQQLDPELLRSLSARLDFYRDMGVYDLYRRGGAEGVTELLAEAEVVVATGSPAARESSPVPVDLAEGYGEEPAIAARKVAPASPVIAITPQHIADKPGALLGVRNEIGDCTRCKLSATRNKIVFADGNPDARLMFVGEGPGADEDAQGLPFVGRAGQLLNNMITAMGLKREAVYIANIVKCRPPGNRVPEPDEAHTCMQFLDQQIAIVQPEVLVALGSTAATYLLGAKSPLSALRGRIHPIRGSKLIVTYHPAFLLRDPRQKKEAWKDLQMAMAELGLKPAAAPSQA